MKVEKVYIKSEYITLGQLLKMKDLISAGGEAKFFLGTHQVYVNDEKENRRGRKLYTGMIVTIEERCFVIA